jgi:hypothetical protein
VVGPATTIEAGLSLAGSESFDAAVLDINVRGERIDPIADLLVARGIPMLFATGYGVAAIAERQTRRSSTSPIPRKSSPAHWRTLWPCRRPSARPREGGASDRMRGRRQKPAAAAS